MVERDDLVATYSVDYVAGVMSLRKPQKESLIRLEKIWNAADIRKGADRGMTALNDLKPILGFELTATPKTNKNGNIYLVAIKRNDQTDDEDVKANLTARSIRSGSSLYVVSGSSGVRMIPAARSRMPPKGSTRSPKESG